MTRRRVSDDSWSAVLLAVILVLGLGWLDWRSGTEVEATIIYLAPILLASARGPVWAGLLVSFLSAIAFTFASVYGGRIDARSVVILNLANRFVIFGTVAFLVGTLRRRLAVETHRARTDPLTGLVSRGAFLERVKSEIERSTRYGRPLSLAYLDLDDFKEVNDARGHAAGDEVLLRTARALEDGTRATDVAGRIGGDEFMVLMPETGPDSARAVVERVQRAIAAAGRDGGQPPSVSIGAITYVEAPPPADEAITRVDDLMYEVKARGKGSYLHDVVEGRR